MEFVLLPNKMVRLTTALAILTVLSGCLVGVSDSKTDPVPKSSPVLSVECNFGVESYPTNTSFRTNSTSVNTTGLERRCQISYNVSYALVRVSLASFPADLYVSVFDLNGGRFILEANADDVTSNRAYRFHSCPNFESFDTTVLNIVFFSTPVNSPFSLGVDLDDKVLQPGQAKEISVREDGLAEALAFEIADEGSIERLEITATTDSEDTVYYLLVSQTCSLVRTRAALFAGQRHTGKVIYLTFSSFGRITISMLSHPKLAPGRWFVGVQVRGARSNTNASKTVWVRHDIRTFSSETPMTNLMLVTFLVGLPLAALGHFFMNPDYANSLSYDCKESCKNWLKVISIHWWRKGLKTFSYSTGAVAIMFVVPSIQFVIAQWYHMIETGNRDVCYYNDACYRPTSLADIPFNLMLSNIPYIVHGLILALFISFREASCLRSWKTQNPEAPVQPPYDFSVAYSFAWGLVFLGLCSMMYHLCPSRLTFQFDTAFMFIISGLIAVAFYNTYVVSHMLSQIHFHPIKHGKEENVPDGLLYGAHSHATPIQAPTFYLLFVAPLILLNYIGSLRDTAVPPRTDLEVLFWVPLSLWLTGTYAWAVVKVFGCEDSEDADLQCCRCCSKFWFKFCCFFVEGAFLVTIFVVFREDCSLALLYSCLGTACILVAGLMLLRMCSGLCCRRGASDDTELDVSDWRFCLQRVTIALFSISALGCWISGIVIFRKFPTTDKIEAPHVSRTYNKECVGWDFFDYHDIWHILSSFALFTSAFLVLYNTRGFEKRTWMAVKTERDRKKQNNNQPSANTNAAYEVNESGEVDESKQATTTTTTTTKFFNEYHL